jgi:hypothetical protein
LTASSHITIIEVDFLDEDTLTAIPDEDAAYLIHSMSGSDANMMNLKAYPRIICNPLNTTKAKQVIYLSGM